jgi:adenylate cyclase
MRHFATIRQGFKVRHLPWWLLTAVLLLAFTGLCLSSYALNLEQKTGLRWLFHWRGPIKPPSDVLIVALNSTAGENLALPRQTSAWPRTVYAELVQQLNSAGARLVVMDIAFREARSEAEDAVFEQALADMPRVVLFKYLRRHQLDIGTGLADIEEEIPPLPRFARHAVAIGSFVLPKYPAEVSRAYLFTDLSRGAEPTQPLQAFAAFDPFHGSDYSQFLSLPNPVPINFYGPAETFPTWTIDTVLRMDSATARNTFANKVVYVGYSDPHQTEQQDAYRTVFSNSRGVDISGVEISATVFANLLQKNYLRSPSALSVTLISLLFFLVAILSHKMPLIRAIPLQLGLSAIYTASAYVLFRSHYLWLPLLLPAMALVLGNMAMWAWHHLQQKRREEEIRYTLTQYLPMDAAQKLSRNFNKLEQQRQLVQGVCLLTDIQGYTRLAEMLPPTELHSLMNRYYAVLIKTVKENGGFIGNLVGDGMLALWTVADITPSTCHAALQTVLKIQERLAQDEDLHQKLPTCFGLHGGQFSLGNLGNTGHFEYSPVGDMINTAARIEHLNRQLDTCFLCSSPIAEHLLQISSVKLRFLGNFSLRNKTVPVALYTYATDAPADLLVQYKRAYEYFTNNQFDTALAEFASLADEYADGPSRYFANACRLELQSKE